MEKEKNEPKIGKQFTYVCKLFVSDNLSFEKKTFSLKFEMNIFNQQKMFGPEFVGSV